MSSLEKIAFLQEKLQDIRNHYLSLKSEVASIDRRRKRMKKKERETGAVAASSSSSSSSPSSSSLTAAVMLTLAEPTVSSSAQNSGVSVECRWQEVRRWRALWALNQHPGACPCLCPFPDRTNQDRSTQTHTDAGGTTNWPEIKKKKKNLNKHYFLSTTVSSAS